MHSHVSIDVLANWVVMLRSDVDGAICIVDDSEESRFYERLLHSEARLVPAPSLAISLLQAIHQRGINGVVAMVRGIGAQEDACNIFRPAGCDVASVLLVSEGASVVLADVFGTPWLGACGKECGNLLLRVACIARTISQIKVACAQRQVDLAAVNWPNGLVDWNSFNILWTEVEILLGSRDSAEFRQQFCWDPGGDLRAILRECEGLDAINLLVGANLSYRPRGLGPSRTVDAASLIAMLIVAFDPKDIENDQVFWKLKKWERDNRRFPLLRHWRSFDPLGVVWDQRYWEADLAALLRNLDKGALLCMFKMDLDNFKHVNEELGHASGDEAIRVYCKTVQAALGGIGEVYRRGGDEIVVLAPGMTEGSAREFAERTRADVEAAFLQWAPQNQLSVVPTASIGLALSTTERSAPQVIAMADRAQQQAKARGKNCVVVET